MSYTYGLTETFKLIPIYDKQVQTKKGEKFVDYIKLDEGDIILKVLYDYIVYYISFIPWLLGENNKKLIFSDNNFLVNIGKDINNYSNSEIKNYIPIELFYFQISEKGYKSFSNIYDYYSSSLDESRDKIPIKDVPSPYFNMKPIISENNIKNTFENLLLMNNRDEFIYNLNFLHSIIKRYLMNNKIFIFDPPNENFEKYIKKYKNNSEANNQILILLSKNKLRHITAYIKKYYYNHLVIVSQIHTISVFSEIDLYVWKSTNISSIAIYEKQLESKIIRINKKFKENSANKILFIISKDCLVLGYNNFPNLLSNYSIKELESYKNEIKQNFNIDNNNLYNIYVKFESYKYLGRHSSGSYCFKLLA